MTTPPTIEPIPDNPALAGEPPTVTPPPGFIPYARPPWYQAHPGVALTLVLALAAGAGQAVEGVWGLFTSAERAERQRLIDAGDRAESEARAESEEKLERLIEANGKATAANGAAIGTMATHALESARHTRLLLRDIAGHNGPSLALPDPLRDAEKALRELKVPR